MKRKGAGVFRRRFFFASFFSALPPCPSSVAVSGAAPSGIGEMALGIAVPSFGFPLLCIRGVFPMLIALCLLGLVVCIGTKISCPRFLRGSEVASPGEWCGRIVPGASDQGTFVLIALRMLVCLCSSAYFPRPDLRDLLGKEENVLPYFTPHVAVKPCGVPSRGDQIKVAIGREWPGRCRGQCWLGGRWRGKRD